MERPKALMFEQKSSFPHAAAPLVVWFGATCLASLTISLLLYKMKLCHLLCMTVVKTKRDKNT